MFDGYTEWFLTPAQVPVPIPPPPPSAPAAQVSVSPGVPTLSVDDAWHLFGFPKKRATRAEVKERYLAMIVQNHPDRHVASGEEEQATKYVIYVNAAWTLLQRHCKW